MYTMIAWLPGIFFEYLISMILSAALNNDIGWVAIPDNNIQHVNCSVHVEGWSSQYPFLDPGSKFCSEILSYYGHIFATCANWNWATNAAGPWSDHDALRAEAGTQAEAEVVAEALALSGWGCYRSLNKVILVEGHKISV